MKCVLKSKPINMIVLSLNQLPYSRFFSKGENFHEFHESIANRENFTLEIFTNSIRHCVLLTRFVKIFLLEKNPLYGITHYTEV